VGSDGATAIVRADDCPALLTPGVRPEVEAKAVRGVGAGVVERGRADVSLYGRFHAAGIIGVRKVPQLLANIGERVCARRQPSRLALGQSST
jgi:hypothetical protein